MNAHAKVVAAEPAEAAGTALVLQVQENPALVLLDHQKFDDFYEAIRRETAAHVPDVSTAKGREAIKSLAYKVTRTKTALDDAGKKLTEDARARINKVDAARRNIREKLDSLRDEVRRPLTEWEVAEEARLEKVATTLADLKASAVVLLDDTAQSVEQRLAALQALVIDEATFQDAHEAAAQAKREQDRAHRSKIMGAAKEAIMEHGEVAEDVAKKIVLAIAANSVPNVSIRW